MKAIRFHEHGGIEKLRFEEVPDPVPGPGEIVVRVEACALNYLDIWERQGLPGMRIPLPHISGSDVAGVVESVGAGVTAWKPGDRTLICPGLSCMHCEMCYRGMDNRCPDYSVLGFYSDGGYAERVKIPSSNALPFPEGMEATDAAALPLVFLTAWHMLVELCGIRHGEDVLILGAGSGVGSAAIQIAKYFRARVITTASTEAKQRRAFELGADHVIDNTKQLIREEVRKLTGKRGCDIVVEHIGATTWSESIASVARHGRLVTCGATTGHEVGLDLRHLFAKQITIMGSYMGTRSELIDVLKLVRAGHLRPVVSSVFPLKDAAIAQQQMTDRNHFGKIVLVV